MKNRSKEIGHIFLIAFGMHIVLYCLVFGIRTLNIFYTDWMIENEYDLGLNCIGTLFFVRSKWILPNIGLMDNLNFPYYKSVVYYDTIPILSIFLKLFRDFLPKRFQFFGLWEWFSFAMQGGLGACCIYKFIKSKWACAVGCLLFSTQLCCLNNFYREIPLSSHWVLLCAFLIALYYNQLKSKEKVLACTGVMALTMFVQTAFLPMVLCILFFRIAAEIFIQKNFRTVWQGGAAMVSGGLGIVLSAWLLGLFHGSTSLSGGGLGTKGIRLDSFVNPQGFSLLFGGFHANDVLYNYRPEANLTLAYIGTGVIILLTLCTLGGVIRLIRTKKSIVDKEERIYLLFAFMAALICIFFALGPKAMWKDTVVYEISLGPVMYKLWSMVRSSYRLAWAVVYGSIIVLVWALAKWNRKWCVYIISAGVFIQLVDMVPFWQDVKVNMENVMLSQESNLVSDTWSELGRTKSKIIIMNADDRSNAIGSVVGLTRGELYDFADLALEYDMEMNDFYYARKDSTALANARASVWKELYSGAVDESAIYVFLENPVRLLQEETLNFYKIDGYLIGVAGPIELHGGDEEYRYRREQPISVLPLPGEYLDQGEKGENGERIILPGGQSYGPRISLNKGRYAVEIVGEGLDEANVYCTAQGEDVPWEKAEKTERGIRYEFILEEMKTKVEFVVENSSGQDVIVHDILLEEINLQK